jgi:hypothetical protein
VDTNVRAALVQFLLPAFDRNGTLITEREFEGMRLELAERFGGVTAFIQSPALGAWREPGGSRVQEDQMILVEVVVEELDLAWWSQYRTRLERTFRQDEIMMRSLDIERI